MSYEPWIGVDLDGTLAIDGAWMDGRTCIGEPVPAMVSRVKRWLAEGKDVRIYTARVACDPDGAVAKSINDWCLKHVGVVLPVTCIKDYQMAECWDDRVVQVIPNTGQRADGLD